MPSQSTAEAERQRLQEISAHNWNRSRQLRVDGYAAALTHLSAAAKALVGTGDESATEIRVDIEHAAHAARRRMRAIFEEPNPFVKESS